MKRAKRSREARTRTGLPTPEKARTILRDKEVRGHPLTKKQIGFFGIIASGKLPRKAKRA